MIFWAFPRLWRGRTIRYDPDQKRGIFTAIVKWFEIKPEIFSQKPNEFKNKILALNNNNQTFVIIPLISGIKLNNYEIAMFNQNKNTNEDFQ